MTHDYHDKPYTYEFIVMSQLMIRYKPTQAQKREFYVELQIIIILKLNKVFMTI